VGCRDRLGVLHGADDLPLALADPRWRERAPWRVHFHAPLHRAEVAGVRTTRDLTAAALAAIGRGGSAGGDAAPVLEVETYTWSRVPGFTGGDESLAENIAAEIAWTRGALAG
jgi:hypothetical protein